jgi:hypothetical protein
MVIADMNTQRILIAAINVASKAGAKLCLEKLGSITSAPEYAEPGYSLEAGQERILFADWNDISTWSREHGSVKTEPDNTIWQRTVKLLEKTASCEWSYEWDTCSDCGKAFRTRGDCYGWLPSYVELDCGRICTECVKGREAEMLESFEGESGAALPSTLKINPADHGYVQVLDRLENGMHHGQDDDPRKIAKALKVRGISRFLFSLDSVGQFDSRFSLWIHEDELQLYKDSVPDESELKADESPASIMERGLKSAALLPPAPPGKVAITTINADGSAVTRHITAEEFVKGVKI